MPKTCSQCQTENADEANNCSNCGAPLAGAATAGAATAGAATAGAPTATAAPTVGQPAAAGAAAAPAAAGSSVPAFKFDAARWTLADRIAGIATLVLFICLFLPWFTISVGFGGISVGGSVNGLWHGWMYLTLIICIAIIAYLVLKAGWERLPITQDIPHLTVMMVATLVNAVLTLIAFIDKPGGSATGWGFGAIVGLIAALVAAAPYAIPPLRARTM
jgi:hypothetical protein